MTRFGFPAEDWKPFRMYDGAEVLVPGGFNVTIDERGDTLMHPLGDRSNPPSARMPNGGYFFDAIIRQQPFDEDHLDPADNLEEYGPVAEEELAHLEREARRAAGPGAPWWRISAALRSAISRWCRASACPTPRASATSRNGTCRRARAGITCTPCSAGNARSRWRTWSGSRRDWAIWWTW
jgi:hypothetical protein